MKPIFTCLIALGSIWSLYGLSVKNFGAVGDGSADDTMSIQRAVTAATKGKGMAHEEVFCPPGIYRVCDTIVVRNHAEQCLSQVRLRGENATILMSRPDKDIFYFDNSFRHIVEGIHFKGGRRQLKFWSNNIDSGHITIRRCRFEDASSFAVDDSLRKDTGKPENRLAVLNPARITFHEDGRAEVIWENEEAFPPFDFTSTQMRITECEFIGNRKAFFLTSDWAFVDRSRIETHPDQEGPAIVSLGGLHLEDVEGVARNNPERKQYWFRKLDCMNQYGINFRNVKLRSSSANGWAVVHNFCRHGGNQNSGFFFDQCEFAVAGSRENSVLWLEQIPNLIHFNATRESSGKEVNAVGFARAMTEGDLVNDPEKLAYRIEADNTALRNIMPSWMARYADRPLPEKVMNQIRNFPHRILTPETDFPRSGSMIRIAAGTPAAEIQKQLNQAAADPFPVLIFTAGHYPLDRSLYLPPRIRLRAEGVALLYASSKNMTDPLLTGDNMELALVEGFYFTNSGAAVALKTQPETKAKILVRDCTFDRLNGWALSVTVGNGNAGIENHTEVTLADSTITFSPALTHNAALASIDNTWITSDATLKKTGSIQNRGCLYLRGMLGVPETSLAGKFLWQREGRTIENDHRWIDNYGRISIDRSRFGGESGGFPAVVNYSASGEIFIRESWCYIYEGNPNRLTILDFEKIPALAVLLNNMGWPRPAVMATVRPGNPKGKILDEVLFESCNVPETRIKDMR